jgi:hypothetical protein
MPIGPKGEKRPADVIDAAVIVGPLRSTTRSRASTAACHSSRSLLSLRQLHDVIGGVPEGD